MAATGQQKSYNILLYLCNKRYRNLNSESFLYVLKYEESNATIILMKEMKINPYQPEMRYNNHNMYNIIYAIL